MPGPFDAIWQWAVAGVSTAVTIVGGVVYRTRERSIENKRKLEGDPGDDNPFDEGLLDVVYETRETVKQLEAQMDRQHHQVNAKLDTIIDGDEVDASEEADS